MATNVNLPPGFQLDQASAPSGQVTPQSTATPNLPQGFVIDHQPNQQPQRWDRFQLQSSQPDPNSTYNYGDALADTGKTVVNSLANLGENTINTVKSIPQIPGQLLNAVEHPIKTVGDIANSVGNEVNQYNSMDKLANKVSTDPMGFGSDVVGAGMMAEGLKAPIQAVGKTVANTASAIGTITQDAKNGIANMLLNPEFKQTASDWAYNHDARRVMASIPGIIGDDFNSTKAAINAKMQETGQAIGDTIANSPASSVPIGLTKQDVTGHIDQIIGQLNQADPNGNAATIQKLLQKKLSLENTFNPDGTLKGPINFQNMTLQQAFDYKQLKLGNIKFTGNDSTDFQAVNAALQQSRQNLTSKMNAALPDLTPLNLDYGDLNAALDAADRAAFKAQGQGIGKFQWADLVNTPINKWILNPQNRMQLAQFLYTAPKSDIQAMGKIIPNFNQTVNQAYGLPSPQSVSPVGSDIPPLNPQTQGRRFSQDFTQPGSSQPIITPNANPTLRLNAPTNPGASIPSQYEPNYIPPGTTTPINVPPVGRSASARYQPNSPASATFNIGKQDIEDAMTVGSHWGNNFGMAENAAEDGSKNVMKFTDLKLLNQFVSDNESKVELISTDSDGNFYAHLKGK